MRVAAGVVGVQPDDAQQLLDAFAARLPLGQVVDDQRLADDAADGHARVQRRVGVLEDHLHLAAEVTQLVSLHLHQVATVEQDLAGGRPVELEDRPPDGRFPAAALAYQAERLAAADGERHVVDRLHVGNLALEDDAGGDGEVHLEVVDLDAGGHRRRV